MHTFTALFDKQEDATHAQSELRKLGIVPTEEVNVSGKDSEGFATDGAADNRGFWQSLKNVFVSDEDRPVYEEGVRQGGWLLTINVDDTNAQRVQDWLESSNAVNVDERSRQYREAGHLQPVSGSRDSKNDQTIPIIEEQLRVGKRVVERGGLRVRAYVVDKPVQQDVTLREENVRVERHAVDRVVPQAEVDDALRNRSVEVRTVKEEPVVAKDARVVEEIVLKKDVDERVERVAETVRRTEVEVNRSDSTESAKTRK